VGACWVSGWIVIQVAPGDLVAVEADGRYYYALILDRVKLFGGNWAFVFHASSDRLLGAAEVFGGSREGYHAFVDFIWARRERRLTRLARKLDTNALRGPGRLKGTNAIKEKAELWFIYDMEGRQLKRVAHLSLQEARYPEYARIDDTIMVDLVKQGWRPERDPRI
jgi:hypothetical protein